MLTDFVIKLLAFVQFGTIEIKIKSLFLLAVIATPLTMVTEGLIQWFHLNVEYISFVFGAVIIDHLLGTYVHAFVKRDFSWKLNLKGFVVKTALAIMVYYLGMGVVYIVGSEHLIATYFDVVFRLMVFLYPASSAFINCAIVTDGKFPPVGLLNKINRFSSNLNLTELSGKNDKKGL